MGRGFQSKLSFISQRSSSIFAALLASRPNNTVSSRDVPSGAEREESPTQLPIGAEENPLSSTAARQPRGDRLGDGPKSHETDLACNGTTCLRCHHIKNMNLLGVGHNPGFCLKYAFSARAIPLLLCGYSDHEHDTLQVAPSR